MIHSTTVFPSVSHWCIRPITSSWPWGQTSSMRMPTCGTRIWTSLSATSTPCRPTAAKSTCSTPPLPATCRSCTEQISPGNVSCTPTVVWLLSIEVDSSLSAQGFEDWWFLPLCRWRSRFLDRILYQPAGTETLRTHQQQQPAGRFMDP